MQSPCSQEEGKLMSDFHKNCILKGIHGASGKKVFYTIDSLSPVAIYMSWRAQVDSASNVHFKLMGGHRVPSSA